MACSRVGWRYHLEYLGSNSADLIRPSLSWAPAAKFICSDEETWNSNLLICEFICLTLQYPLLILLLSHFPYAFFRRRNFFLLMDTLHMC